ncbi:MAG: ABC transporter ATP-binding protein, partial [Lentisphaeria bacterium]|nr:ABC transporter ATP-binding protein [Lentisphaeria bacterium]
MPLLEVQNLAKHFPVTAGLLRREVGRVQAVDGVSFHIDAGETLGLVGESGCGKTTTGRLILRLIERTAGSIHITLDDERTDVGELQGEKLRQFRRHMQLIFQDPFSSLNPRMSVMNIIGEPLRAMGFSRKQIRERVGELTEEVSLKAEFLQRYPHAFSGGQRQRICIARALALQPELVICDEPVSALDVSVQAQILNLLQDLQQKLGLTYLFIAHDLSVVRHISHRVAVMYAGHIVELAKTGELYKNRLHPYTEALLASVPEPDPQVKAEAVLTGEVADPSDLPPGCAFHPRCARCVEQCRAEVPQLRDVGGGHFVACHL